MARVNRYKMFGFTLVTHIDFPMLQYAEESSENVDIKLSNFPYEQKSEYDAGDDTNYFIVDFGINLLYFIPKSDNPSNEILVFSDENEKIRSSFLNIPVSLFLLRYNGLMLHVSCIEQNGDIFGFCGEKGTGKSTLSFLLSKTYNLFSDDSLYARFSESGMLCYRTNSFIRLHMNTFLMYGKENDFNGLHKNLVGKAYVFPDQMGLKSSCKNVGHLKRLYFLKRNKNGLFEVKSVTENILKKIYLLNNIIGMPYVNNELLLKIVYWDSYQYLINNVDFYEMTVPDDLDKMSKLIKSIEEVFL